MPREAKPPRANARPAGILSPQKTLNIPLKDDREEKAVRFQSRQALHEIQMNQIKAAATPLGKRRSLGQTGSPQTPSMEEQENDINHTLAVVGGNAVTPMKRVPILANFEEWMKMATDNKINAANSWNFALIDYFHDMSLLKDGDSVNFQMASCTLDGCVKIYTSRVDSVATETGKLLSGLADSGNKKRKGEEDEEDQGEGEGDEEEGEEGAKKRSKKRAQRSSEATLASSFAQLQVKKMELEFSVDPLFKKASADFDEGGAKGLLLNHLTIDTQGRIVFDSSDDTQDVAQEQSGEDEEGEDEDEKDRSMQRSQGQPSGSVDIDIGSLASRFFPDLGRLDEQEICPSLKTFELGGANDTLNLPFLKAAGDWANENEAQIGDDANMNMNIADGGMGFGDDDGVAEGFEAIEDMDIGFGEGGEAWAKEAAINTEARVFSGAPEEDMEIGRMEGDAQEVGGYEANSAQYGVALVKEKDFDRENILSYFDQALQKNWAGPEHWRIRKIKDNSKPAPPTTKRKEKEPFDIDFMAPLAQAMADMIYTPAASNSAISLPKSQWKSKTRNLLPDDKHFNSRQLLRLFLKPKARIGSRRAGRTSHRNAPSNDIYPDGEMDEAYWARQQNAAAWQEAEEAPAQGDYDANFFQDDGLDMLPGIPDDDDDNFADAREAMSPGPDGEKQQPMLGGFDSQMMSGSQEDGFGTQLVTQSRRLRPEYVQYARVAKKVDIRRLKEDIWKGIGLDDNLEPAKTHQTTASPAPSSQDVGTEADGSLRFTSVMNSLQSIYPKQAMADISTSFCFICLLHLANEKGLVLQSKAGFEEIQIRKDHTAVITEYGE